MPLVNGTLTDFSLDPLVYDDPELLFRASTTGIAGMSIMSRKAVEVIPAANGFFEVNLATTDLLTPGDVHYTVELRYRDPKTKNVISEILPWNLYVPAAGGALGDLLEVPANPAAVYTDTEPPADPSPGTWWMNPETGDLMEWS